MKGRENFEVEGPAIIVSNHQSILDMMGEELARGRERFSCSPPGKPCWHLLATQPPCPGTGLRYRGSWSSFLSPCWIQEGSPLALSHHNPLPASDRVSCPVQVQALGKGVAAGSHPLPSR